MLFNIQFNCDGSFEEIPQTNMLGWGTVCMGSSRGKHYRGEGPLGDIIHYECIYCGHMIDLTRRA